MLHPKARIPLWAAAAIIAAPYVVRSAARGGDFAPDLPADAIVLGAFALLVVFRTLNSRAGRAHESDDHRAEHIDHEDD